MRFKCKIAAGLLVCAGAFATHGGVTPPERVFAAYWAKIATNAPPRVEWRIDPTLATRGCDAYAVNEKNSALCFSGVNTRSLLYAVYDFFARKGCVWFWDGDRLPAKGHVSVRGTEFREESKYAYRAIRYFAHRGLTRFQAEHWGLEDWQREIDWCLKRRLNCMMLRIGMDDTWQRAFPDIVAYPDPTKPVQTGRGGYDRRDLFWSLQTRGQLRRELTAYATERGMLVPTDFGTMTHWYSRTPQAFLDAKKPPYLPQATKDYSEATGLVWDIFQGEWLADYWQLTETMLEAGYGGRELLHTIGLGERLCYADRAKNLHLKYDVMDALFALANAKSPRSKILLAGWDFYSAWSAADVRAFLPRLDPQKVIVWDYEADAIDEWNERYKEPQGNFTRWGLVGGKVPYTFGIFLAYENALDIRANYALIEARQKLVENDPMCRGYIFWPESSHTDIFLLRYFTANAWGGGQSAADLLPRFCRERYGEQSAAFERVWRRIIVPSALLSWGGNYGAFLTRNLSADGKPGDAGHARTTWERALEGSGETFSALARLRWTDDFARRDSCDLARTLLDRLIERDRLALIAAAGGDRTHIARRFVALVHAMTRLLALHEDYSLYDSLTRLNATSPVVNPNFEHVLVDNAVNDYCRSHQYEAAAYWYEPLARDVAAGATDLTAKSAAYHEAMLKRPLAEMRPSAPRTEAAFAALMRDIADLL